LKLKLLYLPSNFAFNFNLRLYSVAAALGEAAAAVETARDETRDAAAAFSAALTLRAWWMHARHAVRPGMRCPPRHRMPFNSRNDNAIQLKMRVDDATSNICQTLAIEWARASRRSGSHAGAPAPVGRT